MKRTLLSIIAVVGLLMMALPAKAQNENPYIKIVDNVIYWPTKSTLRAAVVGYVSAQGSGVLRIPGQVVIEGQTYIVNEIGGPHGNYVDDWDWWRLKRNNTIHRFIYESNLTHELTISQGFFEAAVGLEQVIIKHNGNINIEKEAFQYCVLLSQLTIQTTKMVHFGERCFGDCSMLGTIDYADINAMYEDHAFQGCTNLQTFPLPKRISQWSGSDNNVLDGCTRLEALDLYTEEAVSSGVTHCALFQYGGKELTQIRVLQVRPNVVEIPRALCYGMTHLESVNLMSGSRLTTINDYAFARTAVNEIPQSNSLKSIGKWAFSSCAAMQEINLPASVTYINDYAFEKTHLMYVTCNAINPPTAECGAFRIPCGTSCTDIKLTVPAGSESKYRAAPTWKDFYTNSSGKQEMKVSATAYNTSLGRAYLDYNSVVYSSCTPDASVNSFTVPENTQVCITLHATPTAAGYEFRSWTLNDNIYSTQATCQYNGKVTEDMRFEAFFTPKQTAQTSLVEVKAMQPERGTVRMCYNDDDHTDCSCREYAQSAYLNQEEACVNLYAYPNPGYKFVKWTVGTTWQLATNAFARFNSQDLNDKEVLYAHFDPATTWTVTATPSNTSLGDAYILGNDDMDRNQPFNKRYESIVVEDGDFYDIELVAEAHEGARFVEWTLNGKSLSTSSHYSIANVDVRANEFFIAHFEKIPTYTITTIAYGNGTVTGGGTYEEGTMVKLTATANSGSRFTRWSDGNTDNPRYVLVTTNETYIAEFDNAPIEIITFNVTLTANPEEGGMVIGGGIYEKGLMATIAAVPTTGYEFTGWDDGVKTAVRQELVDRDITLTANFHLIGDGVEEVSTASCSSQGTKAMKVMIDGVIYIVRDGKMYNVLGVEVK